jgi:hypothetical protein
MQKGWNKWTWEMDAYLIDNYEWIGDLYLAEMFEAKFPKGYPWTKKHIEKRRSYLKLIRTTEQEKTLRLIACIYNNRDGKAWDKRGRIPEGCVKTWNGRKYIKVNGKIELYSRHVTKAKPGEIARLIDGEYKIISQATNMVMNHMKALEYPKQIRDTVKTLNQLKKLIYGKENTRSKGNAF